MAVETLTSDRASATFPVAGNGPAQNLKVAWGTYPVAIAAFEIGDKFEMHWVPDGATIVGGWLQCEDLDSGIETVDYMCGWAANDTDAADPNGLLLAGVKTGDISVHLDVASVWMPYGGQILEAGPKTFTKGGGKTMIQVEIVADKATDVAGQLTVCSLYTAP